jgi:regulator of sigma E protease
MYYVIGSLILLVAIIFVHEFGHLIAAKLFGVKVLEFSLGFPPALIKYRSGETAYKLNLIPLGGYVKMLGEDPDSKAEIIPDEIDRAFFNRSVIARISIMLAGPLFNFLLAFGIMSAVYVSGWPVLVSEIGKVSEGSPAFKAGFKSRDRVVAIDGGPVWRWEDMRSIIERNPEKSLRMQVKRDDKIIELSVIPSAEEQKGFSVPVGRIGVVHAGRYVHFKPLDGIYEGFHCAGRLAMGALVTVVKLIKLEMSIMVLPGPLVIAEWSGMNLKVSILGFFSFLAYISVIIAILNLLPIPPLDGGYVLFFLIEAVTRRPIRAEIIKSAVQIGMLLIIFFIVLLLYYDISRIVSRS